jgi:hypothetical protein
LRSFFLSTLLAIMDVPIIGLAQSAGQLQVATATVCRELVNRVPLDAGTKFPLSVGKLSWFTKIIDDEGTGKIAHAWYLQGKERFRVDLTVNGPHPADLHHESDQTW